MMLGQKYLLLVGLVSLSLGALWVATAAAQERAITVEIRHRQVVGDTDTIQVKRGDTVILRWSTDEAVSVHLHGYDIEALVKPETPMEFRFKAYATGRFPITAHGFGAQAHTAGHGDTTLVYLEVLPH
ncbi:hypothetical protein NKDENANG_02547 [Candidatus Entotheonellaceae bacterium PAL068K]